MNTLWTVLSTLSITWAVVGGLVMFFLEQTIELLQGLSKGRRPRGRK
jgi:hypothetical protein